MTTSAELSPARRGARDATARVHGRVAMTALRPNDPWPTAPVVCCKECGSLQRVSPRIEVDPMSGVAPDGTVMRTGSHVEIDCAVCDSPIERTRGRDLGLALACASAGLLLLIPANLLPFLTTSIVGVSRSSVAATSAITMFRQGYPELGIAIGLLAVVLPLARLGLLVFVLGSLRLDRRPRWLGPTFGLAQSLETWAMADVFVLGLVIAYARLHATIAVDFGAGAMCFVAAALLTLVTRAALDPAAVWRAIAPDRAAPAGPCIACERCHLLLPAGHVGTPCPRCAARVHARKPDALGRAAAYTLAAAVLYVPANLYAMATLPIGFSSVEYTVLQGVIDLTESKLFGLAIIVFLASFAIPLLKLAGMAWCIVSVSRRSIRHLKVKTRLYRFIEEIGRWSMVDPFVIACFVPVTQYNRLIHGSAGPAAPMFAAVVILTTLAARAFDPRLLWDAHLRDARRT